MQLGGGNENDGGIIIGGDKHYPLGNFLHNSKTTYPLLMKLCSGEQLQTLQKQKSFVMLPLIIGKWFYMRKPRFT